MLDPANNDFDQLQVKTADGNDGNAMLRLGSQTVFWQAFIGSRVQGSEVRESSPMVSGVRLNNLGIANLGI